MVHHPFILFNIYKSNLIPELQNYPVGTSYSLWENISFWLNHILCACQMFGKLNTVYYAAKLQKSIKIRNDWKLGIYLRSSYICFCFYLCTVFRWRRVMYMYGTTTRSTKVPLLYDSLSHEIKFAILVPGYTNQSVVYMYTRE